MSPPNYRLRVIGSYIDSLTRQIAEAIFIEYKGKLNRKSEFGVNHLTRLEASKSERDRDHELELEAKERADLMSDLCCFINVVQDVTTRSNASSFCRYKRKKRRDGNTSCWLQGEEEDLELTKPVANKYKRRRLAMNVSTPVWNYRDEKSDNSPLTSPILPPPLLNFSNGSFEYKDFDSEEHQSAGLSPALRKLLIRPM